ncbi:dephospho-CoA kinase [Dyella sp.]|jgi:dephospho-CoA kinase|uniref:dephospho-CoA kinase n=1 Tax=Dyella sp. TaxID=1869338 RepID=UPI002D7A20AE|nr:dephospho-CoA kinase [Dyella sp.]HET6433220.1 dephospho-CoA kinase [Dyella sp.]
MTRFVVALTGGVAAGKTATSRCFETRGIAVYDADQAAREVVEPGSSGLAAIVQAFGSEVLGSDGRLDRPAMRHRIFADQDARATLESIVHPRVRQWLRDRAGADAGPYCVLAIPLLVENLPHYRWVDRVLAVELPEAEQMARLMARDGVDEELARRMLASQASRAERLAIADDVIDNRGDRDALDAQVATLHTKYLALSTARTA